MMVQQRSNGRRPTLDDVAIRSGVSKSTVSRVVNGEPRVSAAVVERVRRAVDELGYVPHQAARSLVTRRSDAVALVVTEPQKRLYTDPYFDRQLRCVRKELSLHAVQPVVLLVEEPTDYPRVVNFLSGGHVDGALVFALRADDPLPAALESMGLPAVFGGRTDHPEHRVTFVDADNRDGARQAVRHLVSRGRHRIATITGPLDQAASVARLRGYRDAFPAGPESLIAESDFTLQGGAQAMATLLDRCPGLDAVFAASDLMAAGALRTLRAGGRRVPEEVAVVGFDDLPVGESTQPQLTTVHQDIEAMGREMTRLLMKQIHAGAGHDEHSPAAPSVITPMRLVLRESA
ncbi:MULTISPECIES: LacI family DNA-binding transcriptional regulator [unclassified Streptomyces]|uniref:LacI family DNA-binding transcriptional regulator n=1 Tax=unclassified Streptomyces TaxID=2593676 RepID=UPI0036EE6E1B